MRLLAVCEPVEAIGLPGTGPRETNSAKSNRGTLGEH
jgi:hypothetical protein